MTTRRYYLSIVLLVSLSSILSCSASNSIIYDAIETISNNKPLTKDEVSAGLKEALLIGIKEGAQRLSQENGYLTNDVLKIPFPEELQEVEQRLRALGLNREMDQVIWSLNRAAEDAAQESIAIFSKAIMELSINDAFAILSGDEMAATNYLKSKTESELILAYKSPIEKSLSKVQATKYWSDIINAYNRIPLVKDVDPDLTAYVTKKALNGLFITIAEKEKEIRNEPIARTSTLLQRVFGSQLEK